MIPGYLEKVLPTYHFSWAPVLKHPGSKTVVESDQFLFLISLHTRTWHDALYPLPLNRRVSLQFESCFAGSATSQLMIMIFFLLHKNIGRPNELRHLWPMKCPSCAGSGAECRLSNLHGAQAVPDFFLDPRFYVSTLNSGSKVIGYNVQELPVSLASEQLISSLSEISDFFAVLFPQTMQKVDPVSWFSVFNKTLLCEFPTQPEPADMAKL